MAELSNEQFEQLPEFVRSDYEKVGDNYRHKSEIEFEGAKASFKQKMDDLGGKLNATSSELQQFKSSQQEAIEAAKKEALEQAKTKGEAKDIIKRYEEQMADLESRLGSELESERAEKQKLLDLSKNSARNSLLAEARSKLKVFDESAKIFNQVVGAMIDIDPLTGKETFLSEDGSATSLDRAGFMAQLEKDPAFARMREASPPSEGGFARGANSQVGGASSGGSFGGDRNQRKAAIKSKFNLPD